MRDILSKLNRDMELRGFSENTKEQYNRIIDIYLRHVDKPLAETDESDIIGYLEYLRCVKKLSNVSVNAYLSAIWFLYEVVEYSHVWRPPVLMLGYHRYHEREPVVLTFRHRLPCLGPYCV